MPAEARTHPAQHPRGDVGTAIRIGVPHRPKQPRSKPPGDLLDPPEPGLAVGLDPLRIGGRDARLELLDEGNVGRGAILDAAQAATAPRPPTLAAAPCP